MRKNVFERVAKKSIADLLRFSAGIVTAETERRTEQLTKAAVNTLFNRQIVTFDNLFGSYGLDKQIVPQALLQAEISPVDVARSVYAKCCGSIDAQVEDSDLTGQQFAALHYSVVENCASENSQTAKT